MKKQLFLYSLIFLSGIPSLLKSAALAQDPHYKHHLIDLSDYVIKQEGNTCGFHSAKNAKFILKWLKEVNDLNKSASKGKINQDELATFIQQATQARNRQLHETLDKLVICPMKIIDLDAVDIRDRASILEIDPKLLSIIDDGLNPNLDKLPGPELIAIADFLDNIKKRKKASHAFIMRDMEQQPKGGFIGHWITVVVNFEPNTGFTYYFADSKSTEPEKIQELPEDLSEEIAQRLRQQMEHDLKQASEKQKEKFKKRKKGIIEGLKQILTINPDYLRTQALIKEANIPNFLDSAIALMNRKDYKLALTYIKNIIKAVTQNKSLIGQDFQYNIAPKVAHILQEIKENQENDQSIDILIEQLEELQKIGLEQQQLARIKRIDKERKAAQRLVEDIFKGPFLQDPEFRRSGLSPLGIIQLLERNPQAEEKRDSEEEVEELDTTLTTY